MKSMNNCVRVNKSFEDLIIRMEKECPIDFWDLDWVSISGMRYLSEDFMRRYKDRLHWGKACATQHMSYSFIKEMKDYVIFKVLMNSNKNITLDCLYENNAEIRKDLKEKILNTMTSFSGIHHEIRDVIEYRRSQGFCDDCVTIKKQKKIL